jgi:hypothetical protein
VAAEAVPAAVGGLLQESERGGLHLSVGLRAIIKTAATAVEPDELPAGLTKPELLKALEGGKALRAASLVLRFAQ